MKKGKGKMSFRPEAENGGRDTRNTFLKTKKDDMQIKARIVIAMLAALG
jgi:hypothetical protein